MDMQICSLMIKFNLVVYSVTTIESFIPTGVESYDCLETIKGVPGSYAEEFAKEHNFEFIPIEK